MRSVFTAGVVLAVMSMAADTDAQFRGRLTSRPSIPSAGPRTPAPASAQRIPVVPLQSWPHWWSAGGVWLPEGLERQPPVGDQAPKGGLQLDIQPWSAQVYVDGTLAGRVEQFRGYYQHLELPAGPHTIAVVADGRDPFIFTVMVVPGRVVTQRATLSSSGPYLP